MQLNTYIWQQKKQQFYEGSNVVEQNEINTYMSRSDKKMRESFGILQFFIKEGELSLRLILGGCQRMRPRGRRDDKVAGPLRCPGYVASAQKI